MAQGKILRLQRQPGSEVRPQGMKQDANDRFHGMARLPAESTNRNDFNAVGIIGVHEFGELLAQEATRKKQANVSVEVLYCIGA